MAKRRLQRYVDREVQTTLLYRLCAHWALFMIANVMAITLWTKFMDSPMETWAETILLTWPRVVPFVLVSFALIPVFIWDSVKLSNRFAGPIVRVRRALAQIADGQSPKAIEFRHCDFWKALAVDLNRALAAKFGSNSGTIGENK